MKMVKTAWLKDIAWLHRLAQKYEIPYNIVSDGVSFSSLFSKKRTLHLVRFIVSTESKYGTVPRSRSDSLPGSRMPLRCVSNLILYLKRHNDMLKLAV